MPCIYCKTIKSPNSSTHTLTSCIESANEIVGPIETMFTENRLDIRKQSRELLGYSNGQLAMVCKKFDMPFSGSKTFLIGSIIRKFLLHEVFRYRYQRTNGLRNSLITFTNSRTLTAPYNDIFTASYDAIFADEPSVLRTTLINIMELVYWELFWTRRNGVEWNAYYDSYIETRRSFFHAELMFDLISLDLKDRRKLKKLKIQIAVVQVENNECVICCDTEDEDPTTVVQVENNECVICCDTEDPTAKMGCSHEFCVGCVRQLCITRTKSFISCPMCRAEISSIQVSNAEIKSRLDYKILTCYC